MLEEEGIVKPVVVGELSSYFLPMHALRHMFTCLSLALICALGTNGIAFAASNVAHQTHCNDAVVDTANVTAVGETLGHNHEQVGHAHENQGLVAQHTMPDHDHETCMMHACPALSVEAQKLRCLAGVLLVKVSWPEESILVLEFADGLKRPPKI